MRSLSLAALGVSLAALLAGPAAAQAVPPAYRANCHVCHQADGAGLPGQFPRLKGRAALLAATPDGRRYLAQVAVHGMSGKIVVDGKPLIGVMPSFGSLSDQDLAGVLTYISSLAPPPGRKKPAAFTAAEVKAVRTPRLNATQMKGERERLVAAGLAP